MAPEQAAGERVDARADLWSLGVMMYRMTAGRLPFTGSNTMAILSSLAVDRPPPVATINSAIPAEVSMLIERLMERDRERRIGSAVEVSAEIKRIAKLLQERKSAGGTMTMRVSIGANPAGAHRTQEIAKGPPPLPKMHSTPPASKPRRIAGGRIRGPPAERRRSRRGRFLPSGGGSPAASPFRPRWRVWGCFARSALRTRGRRSGAEESNDVGRIVVAEKPFFEVIPKRTPSPPVASETGKLKHADIPIVTLANISGGHPERVPAEFVGYFGDGRFRLPRQDNAHHAYSEDGRLLAVPTGNDVRLFEVATGRLLRVFCGHTKRTLSAAFTPDGANLVSTSDDETIRVWDPNTGKLKREIEGFEGHVERVAISPDGTELATTCDTAWNAEVRVFDLAAGTRIRTQPGRYFPHALTYSSDGKRLAAADRRGQVHIWDRATGKELWSVDAGHLDIAHLDFSPNGALLAVGSEESVQVFRTSDKQLAYRADGGAFHLQFTPDSRRLVTASNAPVAGGKVIVRDAATGIGEQVISIARADAYNRLHFALSPDGRKAACAPA